MLNAITPKTRIIFIANPNNPTGALASQAKIDTLMARVPDHVVTVFDEAYFEFLNNPPDSLRYVRRPFGDAVSLPFATTSANLDWDEYWQRGDAPA